MDLEELVETEIVETKRSNIQKQHNGYNRPLVEADTTIYVIKYRIGGYFPYSYLNREQAEDSRRNQIKNQTNTFRYYQFNVVSSVDKTITVK